MEGDAEWTVASRRGRQKRPDAQKPQKHVQEDCMQIAAQPQQLLPGWGDEDAGNGSQKRNRSTKPRQPTQHRQQQQNARELQPCCPHGDNVPTATDTGDGAVVTESSQQAAMAPDQLFQTQHVSKRHGKQRHGRQEDTLEARVARLGNWVEECRMEVQACPVYRHLINTMTQAEPHLADCLRRGATAGLPSGVTGRTLEVTDDNNWQAHNSVSDQQASTSFACTESSLQQPDSLTGTNAAAARWPLQSPWWSIAQLVVYGLGSPEDSKTSRYQLAFALLLRDLLPGLAQMPLLFDPAFSDADLLLFKKLDMEVLTVNEQGRRPAQAPTLFYMPHCEHVLYEALLSSNWASGLLPNVVMLGNSLGAYEDSWSCKPKDKPGRPEALVQLVQTGQVKELPVRCDKSPDLGAFNNTALHLFPASMSERPPS